MISCRDMADNIRSWGLTFSNISTAIEYTVNQSGSFALLYDYPAVEYWKGKEIDQIRLIQ